MRKEERQMQCILALVHEILSDTSVTEKTYQHRHDIIRVSRETATQTVTHAIGFQIDDETADDDYDDE